MTNNFYGFTPDTASVSLVAYVNGPTATTPQAVTARVCDVLRALDGVPLEWWPQSVIQHQRQEDEAREVARLAATLWTEHDPHRQSWHMSSVVATARQLLAEARKQVGEGRQ